MKKMKEKLRERYTKYYIKNVSHQFQIYKLYIFYWICSSYTLHKSLNKIIQKPDWPFVSFWNLKSFCFTCSRSFSFVALLAVIRCYSVSLVVTRCHSLSLVATRFYLLYHLLSLVVIRCYSLPLVLPLVVIRRHSLYHSLLLDVPLVCLFINDPE